MISTLSVGVDHIDLNACKRRKVTVGYTPGVLDNATAELAVALLLATSRRIVHAADSVKVGMVSTLFQLILIISKTNNCRKEHGVLGLH